MKYATLKSLADTIRGPMQANNLMWSHSPAPSENAMVVSVVTRITHVPTGEFVESALNIPMQKADAQKIGSAMTYAMRYTLMAMLGLAPKDDDGNEATRAEPTQSKASSREDFKHVVETIRAAKNEAELREYWLTKPYAGMPQDWVGENSKEKDEKLTALNNQTQSAQDSLNDAFPGDSDEGG
jgi:hypothetical protein